jgi:hypothetical protein
MAYSLPTFNLTCNIWRNGNPTTNPPDVVSPCNLAIGRRVGVLLAYTSTLTTEPGGAWLLLPPATDIRDAKAPAGADTVEVGAGSGRFYSVVWVEDIGGGFPNEHRFAEVVGLGPWPVPFPRPAVVAPPPPAPAVASGTFSTTGTTFTLSYTAPAGPLWMAWYQTSKTSVAGATATSALSGALTDYGPGSGPSFGSIVTALRYSKWTSAGGPDTITFNFAHGTCLLAVIVQPPSTTVDVDGPQSGAVSPVVLTASGPTTSINETCVTTFAGEGATSPPSWPSGWTPSPAAWITGTDPNGNNCFLTVASHVEPTAGTLTVSPTIAIAVGFAEEGYIAAFV